MTAECLLQMIDGETRGEGDGEIDIYSLSQ